MAHLVTKIAEYGIVVNEDKEFLMLRFSKQANPGEKWIFPGGRLDEFEEPKKALVREIHEETKLDVKVMFPCDVAMWGEDDDHRYAIFFICKLISKNEVELSREHQEYRWFSFDQIDKINYHDNSFKAVLKNAWKLLRKVGI